ncbi:YbbR-like domain-containing protein [Jeotgalibacillus malaysiensis]|uniref:CdaR family protein n=1 Tax=Jeotgalibacillus malaysiensis TaxID=1508404 RepID=UPI00384B6751
MDKFLESRWFLRGFALLVAVLMFITVNTEEEGTNTSANSQNDVEVIESVPVDTIYNEEELVVTGVPNTVDVTIEGPTQFVTRTNAVRDFRVFINLADLELGTHEVELQPEGFSSQLTVTISPAVATVTIDERITEEFAVDAEFNQSIIPEGYELQGIESDPETVQVTGARNVIESIRYVRATVDIEGQVEDEQTIESTVQVLNANLDKLPVAVEPQTVDLNVTVSQPSKEVTLVPVTSGTPADGFELDSIELTTETVTIYGPTDTIDNINEIEVPFDLSGVSNDGSRIEVPIPVPEGVTSLSSETVAGVISLTESAAGEGAAAEDESEETAETPSPEEEEEPAEDTDNASNDNNESTEELTLSALPVEMRNIGDELQTTFLSPASGELNLRVTGEPETLEELSKDDVSLFVDAEGLEEGEHEMEVQIEGPSNVTYILSQSSITFSLATA